MLSFICNDLLSIIERYYLLKLCPSVNKLPLTSQRYAEEAAVHGSHVLEAPITGGMIALKKGHMTAHVGGDKALADAMSPLLDVWLIFYLL